MQITTKCDFCGISISMPPSRFKRSKEHFCCRSCHMQKMNAELNPTRMTPEVRRKLREARLGTGEGLTYTKIYGKAAHRVVAEQMLGRKLLPGEVVHHLDGNKQNNDPENLYVFASQAEHAEWHMMMR